jgi:hypothetical protein
MICQFCKQDVSNPCHNAQEMKHRAMWHVPHCEKALRSHPSSGSAASTGQVAGGGRR